MKKSLAPVVWMAFGAVLLLPIMAGAQVPFSSTQSPGLSPFNRSNPLPVAAPPRSYSNQSLPGYPTGASTPGSYPMMASTVIDPDHKLGPRDVLNYNVVEDRDNERHQMIVTDSGEVTLGLGNLRVTATGKTTRQLEIDIKRALEGAYYRPGHATVSVGLETIAQGTSKGRVFLTGELSGRGAVDLPVDGQLTVVQAILQMGGFTQDSNLKRVFIYRKGGPKEGIRVDAKAVLHGENDKDVVLQPGDTVKVDKRIIGFDW